MNLLIRIHNGVRRYSLAELYISAVLVAMAVGNLESQTFSNLADPLLGSNASITQNNRPGTPLSELLINARAQAPSRGILWKGLDILVTDDEMVSTGSIEPALSTAFQKQACQADVIAVGRPGLSAFHVSASQTMVYGDFIFVVDQLLKDNRAASIQGRSDIVVTRPGGSLLLPDGSVTVKPQAFPLFQPGATYLIFLKHIPQSSAYQAISPLSTLIASGPKWIVAREIFSKIVLPGFTKGQLETTIKDWVSSCR